MCGTPVWLTIGPICLLDKDLPDYCTKTPYTSAAWPHPVWLQVVPTRHETGEGGAGFEPTTEPQ